MTGFFRLVTGRSVETGVNHGIAIGGDVTGTVVQNVFQGAEPFLEPALTWREFNPKHEDLFVWLHWHARLTALVGRDAERQSLTDWAAEDGPLRARFLSGEGGIGKSRLAAEVAQALRDADWTAGFVRLDQSGVVPLRQGRKGLLLVIDYPEEHRERVRALLRDLANLEGVPAEHPVRLLFLSRRGPDLWQDDLDDTGATVLFDAPPVTLTPLTDPDTAFALFQAVQKAIPRRDGAEPQPVDAAAFRDWLPIAETNRLPLFVLAAAIHSVLEPAIQVVTLAGPKVIRALVRRECRRLANESRDCGFQPEALARLTALAAVRGGLDERAIDRLAAPELDIGLGPAVVDRLRAAGRFQDGRFPEPGPDLFAAALVVETFKERPDRAPEWLWAVVEHRPMDTSDRIGRLAYDAEVVLGFHEHRLSRFAAAMVKGNGERCLAMEEIAERNDLPGVLAGMAAEISRTLSQSAEDEARAGHMNNLSVRLGAVGDGTGALAAIREAARVYRRLAAAQPARFEPELATVLNNLSARLGMMGNVAGAVAASREVVNIHRRLADAQPARFEPDLALSLNNLSNGLSDVGDFAGALAAIREAETVYRRLAAAQPASFEPDLGTILNNLSLRLGAMGDRAGALAAIQEAVAVYRRLAAAQPARFEPELAGSLNNLSIRLGAEGDGTGALAAIREAVVLHRRLAAAQPARFEPELATSLNNLSNSLSAVGDGAGALAAIREAVAVYRRLAAAQPARFEPELAGSLAILAQFLHGEGDSAGAVATIKEALALIRPYAEAYPQSQSGRWQQTMLAILAECEGRVPAEV